MECISCASSRDLMKNNGLMYCRKCYDDMMKILLKYDEENENGRNKTYIAPVNVIDNIYIGQIDSVNEEELKKIGIDKILIAGKRLKNKNHDNFDYMELFLDDSLEQEIKTCCSIANNFIDSNPDSKILIHCYSGISRSATVLIAYIMHKLKMNYNDAFTFVKKKYPIAHPNDNFVNQLKNLHPSVN